MGIVQINKKDNVAVAVEQIKKGQSLVCGGKQILARTAVNFGHKIALSDIPGGGVIIKYGYPIGFATTDIKAGDHVHKHNLRTGLDGVLNYTYTPKPAFAENRAPGTFMGYRRPEGKTGIRNEIWILPTVGCVNAIGESVAQKARQRLLGSVEGVYSFSHPYGCSQAGDDHKNTQKVLCGLAKHPNAGGVLVLGLGCENNNIAGMRKVLGEADNARVKFLSCQDYEDETSAALNLVDELIAEARWDTREPVPSSELIVGLKCGGSDGLSGITANPLAGAFTDRLVAEGGSAIMTEVPEMFGAETILMDRCKDEYTFEKTVSLINDFKTYLIGHGQPVFENPSLGNKEGGLTTLEEKSLGCIQKAGTAAVAGVLSYGEPLEDKGLNLLQSPGNDLVASTALAVSGAHLIIFTTGRGTPFGAPVPTVKVSSNTPLYRKKRNWIDFDAGILVTGAEMDETADRLYDYILSIAGGDEHTRTERNGIREIAIFKSGVTL